MANRALKQRDRERGKRKKKEKKRKKQVKPDPTLAWNHINWNVSNWRRRCCFCRPPTSSSSPPSGPVRPARKWTASGRPASLCCRRRRRRRSPRRSLNDTSSFHFQGKTTVEYFSIRYIVSGIMGLGIMVVRYNSIGFGIMVYYQLCII